jgi:hypothetical protein
MLKRVIVLICVMSLLVLCLTASTCGVEESTTTTQARKTEASAKTALAEIPTYQPQYFNERRTVDRWAKEFDTPTIEAYIYIVSYGNILGYYVTDGKPVSTESYLIPEEDYYMNGYGKQNMDIDGTYGANQPGVRFFTASGVAVEWAGAGASWFFTTAPMPLNVPNLDPISGFTQR